MSNSEFWKIFECAAFMRSDRWKGGKIEFAKTGHQKLNSEIKIKTGKLKKNNKKEGKFTSAKWDHQERQKSSTSMNYKSAY